MHPWVIFSFFYLDSGVCAPSFSSILLLWTLQMYIPEHIHPSRSCFLFNVVFHSTGKTIMAGKTIVMSKIKQVLRLYQQGISNRQIGISLGIYKGTVNNYIKKLKAGQYNIVDLMRLDDPVLEGLFHPGSPAYLQERFTEFKPLILTLKKSLDVSMLPENFYGRNIELNILMDMAIHSFAIT